VDKHERLKEVLGRVATANFIKSPAELWAISDRQAFHDAVLGHVRQKRDDHGFESLTPFERTVSYAADCQWREMQGTLLDEACPSRHKTPLEGDEHCSTLAAVLEEIGARAVADAFRRARALYAGVSPELAVGARTPAQWYELVGEDKIDAIEATMPEGEVRDCLFVFVNENRDRVRPE
jgi:hypothetical protein